MPLGQGTAHEPAQLLEAGVGDPIVGEQTLPPSGHEAPLEQQRQVLARVGLRGLGERAQLLDGSLPFEQGLEQRQTGGVSERAEPLRDDFEGPRAGAAISLLSSP